MRRPLILVLVVAAAACSGPDGASQESRESADSSGTAAGARPGAQMSTYTNRLIHEKSPYLLQHAHNPVDWYPWGDEAFEKSRKEDKPIFLSVGYSTCHWCHVMERESFENEEIAALLNEHFVPVKVDREERPDVDNLYMTAVQGMTGSGGWPMSVFLTQDLKPFFAGTYFPPDDRFGRPGFKNLLLKIVEAWDGNRDQLQSTAEQVAEFLKQSAEAAVSAGSVPLTEELLAGAVEALTQSFDPGEGGFGPAPKFPTPHKPRFLLSRAARTDHGPALRMARVTLDKMAAGGIHDHLAGGFHRYSTDGRWLVPHFEKMLYDQAGLALAYTEAWQATDDEAYRAVARGICDYVLAYLTDQQGGFYSAEDADSEGVEGKFYVWQQEEILEVLGEEDGRRFAEVYRASPGGNWEDANILHTADTAPLLDPNLAASRQKLLQHRDARIRPHLDDKVVTAWNGYMIEAMARAGWAFSEPKYIAAAEKAAAFIEANLYRDGRLLRHYRQGAAAVPAYLDDYAFLASGYLALYETTFRAEHLLRALDLARDMVTLFSREDGGFVFNGSDDPGLLTPVIESYDGAMPSGNSMAACMLLRLGHLAADQDLKQAGWRTLEVFSGTAAANPPAYAALLGGVDFAVGPSSEIVLAGNSEGDVRGFVEVLRSRFMPGSVRAANLKTQASATALIPYLQAQGALDGKPTAYVCRDYACRLPVHDPEAFARELADSP